MDSTNVSYVLVAQLPAPVIGGILRDTSALQS